MSPWREWLAGRRVLVTGASGFVGRWVARLATAAGAEVILAARDAAAVERLRPDWRLAGPVEQVDLSAPGSGGQLVERVAPGLVVNCCGYGVDRSERDEGLATRLNAHLPGELAAAAATVGAVLVHLGTALEYGTAAGDLREGTPPRPTTLYGRTKLAGTLAVAEVAARTGSRAVTARLFTVYGPGEHPGRLVPTLLGARAGGAVPLSSGRALRDFTYVGDVAEGVFRLAAAGFRPGEAVNLATGRLLSVAGFCRLAASVLRLEEGNLDFGALPDRPEEMAHDPVSIDRLRALTGWSPPTEPAEGLAATARFPAGA